MSIKTERQKSSYDLLVAGQRQPDTSKSFQCKNGTNAVISLWNYINWNKPIKQKLHLMIQWKSREHRITCFVQKEQQWKKIHQFLYNFVIVYFKYQYNMTTIINIVLTHLWSPYLTYYRCLYLGWKKINVFENKIIWGR